MASSVGSMMSIRGSANSCLLARVLFKVKTKAGSSLKLESIPKKSVTATNPPRAIVPPKLDNINTENPKNSTIEV